MSDLNAIIQQAQSQFSRASVQSEEVFTDSAAFDPLNEIHRSAKSGTLPSSVLAGMIDHTLLKPDASETEIRKLCAEASQHSFASVCVNSSRVALAHELLAGSSSYAIAVVGFPLGACTTSTKVFETTEAIRLGAREIDMVLAIGALKDRSYSLVFEDIRAVVQAAQKAAPDTAVKVILETALLTNDEKIAASVIAREAGAHFVKTSTGFLGGGATVADVRLMRAVVGTRMKVKASGGIRSRADALKMIAAGADRVGASASVLIVTDSKEPAKGNGY